MNLDEQLRGALESEADMRTAPPPDLDRLISGGQTRRRRRNAARTGVAVAAAVLVVGGAFGATQLRAGSGPQHDPGVLEDPTDSNSADAPRHPLEGRIPPGTYRRFVSLGDDAQVIEADLTYGIRGWEPGDHPVLYMDGDWGGASVYSAERLAGTDHCSLDTREDRWLATSRPASDTPAELAEQLAALPQSTVVAPITTTRAFGYDALHLRLRIADDCFPGVYHLADTSLGGGHGISYSETNEDVLIDFVVVDVDGTPVIAEYWHHPGADPELVAEVSAVRNSTSFVTIDRHVVE